jgi:hypothetical protein
MLILHLVWRIFFILAINDTINDFKSMPIFNLK